MDWWTSRTRWTSRIKNLSPTLSGVKKHTIVSAPIANNNKSRKTKRKFVLYILKMKKIRSDKID